MRVFSVKLARKVRGGKVLLPGRSSPTPQYYAGARATPVIERRKPGDGYRHILKKADVSKFVGLLPHWTELSVGLNTIVLATREKDSCEGWHRPGIVAICAWERGLWVECGTPHYEQHRNVFDRLAVPCEPIEGGYVCKFSKSTARAYQLLHVLLHELGHHHDRMTTRSKRKTARGDGFAESYAREFEPKIWKAYLDAFGLDEK